MLEAIKKGAAGLVDHLGRAFQHHNITQPVAEKALHPLDDPAVWERSPMYAHPSEVNIEREQETINRIYGTTKNNEPIMKLVWTGDVRYWFEYYTEWYADGRPAKAAERWPRIRYKALRDAHGKKIRDVFPPRWLILTRIEPEQYAHAWKGESWIAAPELSHPREVRDPETGQIRIEYSPVFKQIRPDEPPPVFWLWWSTIANHDGFCCTTRRKNHELCFGTYAPPSAAHEELYVQAQGDRRQQLTSPFERIEYARIDEIQDEYTGYKAELASLEVESQVYLRNPAALIGTAGMAALGSQAKIDEFVKNYIDKELNEIGSKA